MAERTVIKTGKNIKFFSDGTFTISNVRASYPHVGKKWAKKSTDTPAFSITGILANSTHAEAIKMLRDEAERVRKEGKLSTSLKDSLYCIRDGDIEKKPEYADSWIIAMRETQRPAVLQRDKTQFDDADEIEETIQPGSRIDLMGQMWSQDNEHGQRVNCSLRGVRYLRMIDGEEIGEGAMDAETVASSFDDDDDFDGDGDDENGGL